VIHEGEVLGGKYRLEKEIGRGSMGTVWSAVHLTLGRRVAIKLISAEHAHALEARQRFGTEAKAAARLRSRYVVQVYDEGETPTGTPYIVLEYLAGETLEQRLERERDVSLNDAVRITRHVARALSRAHAAGIVHRDLKPANVFLARSDDDDGGWLAKVLDFGVAKVAEHGIATTNTNTTTTATTTTTTTTTGTLLGTPLFMSPEQVHGANSVDGRSDLYSLGMLFYTMVTGGYAFDGESFAEVLVAICTGPLPDLRAAAPWVPSSVANWFKRACARDIELRFQSADELIEALDLALGVTTGPYPRQPSPEMSLGTLRDHAPVHHSIPHAAASDSGHYAMAAVHTLKTDAAQFGSDHLRTAKTLAPDALVVASGIRSPAWRKPRLVGGGGIALFALFALFAGALLVRALLAGASPVLSEDRGKEATKQQVGPANSPITSVAMVSPTPVLPPHAATPVPVPVPVPVPMPIPAAPAPVSSRSPAITSGAARVTSVKPAMAAPRGSQAVSKGLIAPVANPRGTNTDIGF